MGHAAGPTGPAAPIRWPVGFERAREIGAASALAEWRGRQVLPGPEVVDGAAALIADGGYRGVAATAAVSFS